MVNFKNDKQRKEFEKLLSDLSFYFAELQAVNHKLKENPETPIKNVFYTSELVTAYIFFLQNLIGTPLESAYDTGISILKQFEKALEKYKNENT